MKYLGVILVVALVAGQVLAERINENDSHLEHSRVTRGLNDKLRNFLEKLKTTLREGNDTLGIPQLDPFEEELLQTKFDEQLLKGSGELSNFEILGLSDYEINKAEISLLSSKLTIGLTWPRVDSRGSYKLNAVALDKIDVYGEGKYRATLTNLSFQSVISLKVSGGLAIKKMDTKISLDGLALSMTGLYDDDETSAIVSEVVTDMAPQLLQDYHKEITEIVNEKVMEIGNEKLDGKSLSDLLGIIG